MKQYCYYSFSREMRHQCPALHLGEGNKVAPLFSQREKVLQIHMHKRRKSKNTKEPNKPKPGKENILERWKREWMCSDQTWEEKKKTKKKNEKKKKARKSRDSNSRNGGRTCGKGSLPIPWDPISWILLSCQLYCMTAACSFSLNSFLDKTLFHPKGRNLDSDNSKNQCICWVKDDLIDYFQILDK